MMLFGTIIFKLLISLQLRASQKTMGKEQMKNCWSSTFSPIAALVMIYYQCALQIVKATIHRKKFIESRVHLSLVVSARTKDKINPRNLMNI